MPSLISKPIRALIQEEFELGHNNDAILTGPYAVNMRALQRMRCHWLQYDTVFIPNDSPGGRPKIINQYIEKQLLRYLKERPMSYLNELIYMLFDEFDIAIDENTVWRTLHRLDWSHKRMRRMANQRNAFLSKSWFAALTDWRVDQLIFLNESTTCERTGRHPAAPISQILKSSGDRRYGWASLGMRPWISEEFKRSKRWSLLPAFTI